MVAGSPEGGPSGRVCCGEKTAQRCGEERSERGVATHAEVAARTTWRILKGSRGVTRTVCAIMPPCEPSSVSHASTSRRAMLYAPSRSQASQSPASRRAVKTESRSARFLSRAGSTSAPSPAPPHRSPYREHRMCPLPSLWGCRTSRCRGCRRSGLFARGKAGSAGPWRVKSRRAHPVGASQCSQRAASSQSIPLRSVCERQRTIRWGS